MTRHIWTRCISLMAMPSKTIVRVTVMSFERNARAQERQRHDCKAYPRCHVCPHRQTVTIYGSTGDRRICKIETEPSRMADRETNSDLQNLLAAIAFGALFLDGGLDIKRLPNK
jgi:hypothetical protein